MLDQPLLYKGRDFSHTDLQSALKRIGQNFSTCHRLAKSSVQTIGARLLHSEMLVRQAGPFEKILVRRQQNPARAALAGLRIVSPRRSARPLHPR